MFGTGNLENKGDCIMINVRYNYLIEDDKDLMDSKYDIENRVDPDSSSKTLYEDVKTVFFANDNPEVLRQKYKNNPEFYTLVLHDNGIRLISTDYIGPSVHWAQSSEFTEDEIRDFLRESRTIGGHVAWERGSNIPYKVNTARGGEDGLYDRIDLTLLLLKIYKNSSDLNSFSKAANALLPEKCDESKRWKGMYNAFSASSWLNNHGFDDYCSKFMLYGSFVDEKDNVILMADIYPILPNDYHSYAKNVVEAIGKRNAQINKEVKKQAF